RIDANDDGTDPDNWANNDGYTRVGADRGQQLIVGTPGAKNSKHWPMKGFFCGDDHEILGTDHSGAYEPSGEHCTAMWGDSEDKLSIGGSIFNGDVGSSTEVAGFTFSNRPSGSSKIGTTNFDASPGEYFVALWRYDNNVGGGFSASRIPSTYSYITTGSPSSAPLDLVIVPFTIE
ncbi:MAG TPA: hypothetical protein VGP13_04495, partial [Candidatus Paceibacterota bacterium]|nr:hypothetical protein [Candidatus Paceibacterota bacterium]